MRILRYVLPLVLVAGPAVAGPFDSVPPAGNGTVINPSGTSAAVNLANLAAQQGVLLDAFKQAGDADDTASLTRAVAEGVPILLGPHAYTINNFATGTIASFILKGVKGQSIITRTSGSGTFFSIKAAAVYIDGVIFDGAAPTVTGSSWGVLLNAGGQTVSIKNSVFQNMNGSLGACLALVSTGPGAGGSFNISDNEITNCTFSALYTGSMSNGVISGNYVHDNSGIGISVARTGAASSTNYAADIVVEKNTVARNASTGILIGGFSSPYVIATQLPAAIHVAANNNVMQDNAAYELALQGDYLSAVGNIIDQSAAAPTVFGAIDSNSRYSLIASNTVTLSGSSFGIDGGGSIDERIEGNIVTMDAGTAINMGGSWNCISSDNTLNLTGTAYGITIYNVDGGGGTAWPTVSTGVVLKNNTFNMVGNTVNGIGLFDNPGGIPGNTPTVVEGNSFYLTGSGTGASQDINSVGSGVQITRNRHNGNNIFYVDPNGSGDVVFPTVYLGGAVAGLGSTTAIRSLIPDYVNTYAYSGSVLYAYPTAGGSGYVPGTTTIAFTGTGCTGQSATAMINQGVIYGVRINSHGTGCSGTVTAAATDSGGGSGATFQVVTAPTLPGQATLTYESNAIHMIQKNGGPYGLSSTTGNGLVLDTTTALGLVAHTAGTPPSGNWYVTNYITPTMATASLPTCNSGSKGAMVNVNDASSPTYGGTLSGGGAVLTPVFCNGTNWITH